MAVDMVLKLEGIVGESAVADHNDEIDILSYAWGATQTGSFDVGKGGGTGKVNIQDMSFIKFEDKATTELMKHCVRGIHIPTGKLTCRKAGDKPLDYLVIDLKDILVSSVSHGGSSDSDRRSESFSINFREFEIKYTVQSKTGAADTTTSFSHDIAAGAT